MPAPPNALVEALAAGTVFRHIFFRMTHPQGTVLAWDGIGQIEFDSEVYHGVGSFAEVGGVSNSADIQNHRIELTLNAVPYDVLRTTDPDIKNQSAKLSAVWIAEDGTQVASRTLFQGLGSFIRLKTEDDTATLRVFLRGPAVDWTRVPRHYYSPADQNRLFPEDTGFSQIPLLENAVIAGWEGDPEAATGAFVYTPSENVRRPLRSTDNKVVGHNLYGPFFDIDDGEYKMEGGPAIVERTSLTPVVYVGGGQGLTVNGQQLLIDGNGFVTSSVGNFIVSADNPDDDNYRLRIEGAGGITSGWRIRSYGGGTARPVAAGFGENDGPTAPDYSRRVYDESDVGTVQLKRTTNAFGDYFWFLRNQRTGRTYYKNGNGVDDIFAFPANSDFNLANEKRLHDGSDFIETDSDGIIRADGSTVRQLNFDTSQSKLRIWA